MQLRSGGCEVQKPPRAPLGLHRFAASRTKQKLLQGIQHLPVVQYFSLRQGERGKQALPPQIPEGINTNCSYGVSI